MAAASNFRLPENPLSAEDSTGGLELNELERKFWRSLLDAELRSLYYSRVSGRLHKWDFRTKIFMAITSSSTVAGWSIWHDATAHPNLVIAWKVTSAIAAITAVAMPIVNLSKRVEWAQALHQGYAKILEKYEIHWTQIQDLSPKQTITALNDLKRDEDALSSLEAHFPGQDDKLVLQLQNKIKTKRGLSQ